MSLSDKISAVVAAIGAELKLKADAADLASVATSGSYDDLADKPAIPPPLPSQSGNAGKVLSTDGSAPEWIPAPSGGGGGDTSGVIVVSGGPDIAADTWGPGNPPELIPGDDDPDIGGQAYATAVGRSAVATESYATATGAGAQARTYATATGAAAQATGIAATATGQGAQATGTYATATGVAAQATGIAATATGQGAQATGTYATATGQGAQATGQYAFALGYLAKASAVLGVAIGPLAVADHAGSAAIGTQSTGASAATTTRDDQIMLGTPNHEVNVPGQLVLASPDGSEWSVTVDNTGALSATART